MYSFAYSRPDSLAEAVSLLADEGATALAGGQTLMPTLKARLAMPERLVEISRLAELRGIQIEGNAMSIGAGTPHAEVAIDPKLNTLIRGLARLAGQIGDPQVRNRGTLGGSVANNDPSACYPAAVLALGATIITDRREITAEDFFTGMFETALEQGEIIVRIAFPVPERSAYCKIPQPASRYAMAGAYVAKMRDGTARVAVTGVSENGVFRWSEAEAALSANYAPTALEGLPLSSDGVLGDIHADPEYRAHLGGVAVKRAVIASL